ncbi:MAG TPA: glucose 1-dehydrogenase [Chthonomonadales bacterium]|nr:glucose 1-dehydrogenase [Chthonomonadales bacterium]
MQPFDLSGKAALVTGGASGLGKAIALGLARAGAVVAVASRDRARVDSAVEGLLAIGLGHIGLTLDVANPNSVEAAFRELDSKLGRLDVLVNSAGTTRKTDSLELSLDEWSYILAVNLTGTFHCCQEAGRRMRGQGSGSIINIASIASYVGLSDVAAYCASKAGVVSVTQSLANDWAQYNIRVNAIAPGVFPTPLNRSLIEGTPRGRWFQAHTPLNRFGEPEEIAGAAVFLASPAASYITGETLRVDGGMLARGVGPAP